MRARSLAVIAAVLAALIVPLSPGAASAQQLELLVGGETMWAPNVVTGEPIPVEITLACAPVCGAPAEWWIWVESTSDPAQTWYYDGAAAKWRSGSAPSFDRPLADTGPLTLPGRLTLPVGQWQVRFAVDTNRGGVRHEGSSGYTEHQPNNYYQGIFQSVDAGFFDDFFDGNLAGWAGDGSGAWGVSSQILRVAANARMRVFWTRHQGTYDDFFYGADLRLRAGDALSRKRGFGLIFRSGGNYRNCYVFHINANGYYLILRRVNGRTHVLRNWTPAEEINQGIGAWNRLEVGAYGTSLNFRINGTQVDQLYDDAFSSGTVGVKAFGDSASGDRFQFDNVRLRAGGD